MSQVNSIEIFDRALVRRRRERAVPHMAQHRALSDVVADEMTERLADIKKEFQSALQFGALSAPMHEAIQKRVQGDVIVADTSFTHLRHEWCHLSGGQGVVADDELLPFAPKSFDVIISHLGLHWVNDLPGALVQIHQCLRAEGIFLASLLGGATLHELRNCLLEAELAVTGGVSPRFSPTLELKTASALLQRATFTLPVADTETYTLLYSDIFSLMREVRWMGLSNAHLGRLKHPTRKAVFNEAGRLYQQRFGKDDGMLPATFEVIYLHGWK